MIVKTMEDDWMRKSPGIAAVLSFFVPGAGFIYCERYLTGILVFLFYSYMWYRAISDTEIWFVVYAGLTWAISIWRSAKSATIINDIIDDLDAKST